jgi:hypothetical protein
MENIKFAVILITLCLAVTTFVWQWRTWLYEGAKIKVKLSWAAVGLVPGTAQRCWQVSAVNVGRSPTEITGWGFELLDKTTHLYLPPYPIATPIPSTLAGGHGAQFFVTIATLTAALNTCNAADRAVIRPYVEAAGEKVYATTINDCLSYARATGAVAGPHPKRRLLARLYKMVPAFVLPRLVEG